MSYIQYNVNVSKGQEDKLHKAIKSKKAVSLRLSKDDLVGDDVLLLTQSQISNIERAKAQYKGVTLKLSGKQIRANLKVEGGFLGMLASLAARFLPTLLGGLATGLISGGIEKGISGGGLVEKDGFFIQKDSNCYEGTYSGKGLYLSPSGYRTQHGDGLYLRSGGNIYEGGSILDQIPIFGPILRLLGL